MRLLSHFAFLFALLTTQIIYAEPTLRDTSIYVHFYGVDEGLPHPDVSALFLDSFGLLWIGTKGGGLSCFTSSRFFNFAPNPTNPDSLNCGNIYDIAEDPVHNIWLVTQKGLTCYNRTFMRFENYEIDYYARDSIHYQGGLALGFDPQGICWIATMRGLLRFDPYAKEFALFDFPYSLNPNNIYLKHKLLFDREGNIWTHIAGLLFAFNPHTKQFNRINTSHYETGNTTPELITGFGFDKQFRLYVATHEAIYVYHNSINLPYTYPIPTFQNEENKPTIDGFWIDHDDDLWCLIDNKIFFIDRETGSWCHYKNIFSISEQLGAIPCAACDFKDENTYFFPIEGGFAAWRIQPHFFVQEQLLSTSQFHLNNRSVKALFTLDDNVIWLATSNGHILKQNRKENSLIDSKLLYSPSHKNTVTSFTTYNHGRSLLATTKQGLIYYDPSLQAWTKNPKDEKLHTLFTTLQNKNINALKKLSDAQLLFALNSGLFLFNHNSLLNFTPLLGRNVQDIEIEDRNSVICIVNGQLFRADLTNLSLTPITYCDTSALLLPKYPNAIALTSSQNYIWIGTDDGLFYLHKSNDSCFKALEHPHFKTADIRAMAVDEMENIWIATTNKIVEFDPHTKKSYLFNNSDGIIFHSSFNPHAVFVSPAGTIYFGGLNGFTHFLPSNTKHIQKKNDVLLTKLELTAIDQTTELPTLTSTELIVPPKYLSLTFHFALLNYTSKRPPRFQIKFSGLYERWTEVETHDIMNVNNLPPGKYTFQFRASENGEDWFEGKPYTLVVQRKTSFPELINNYFLLLLLLLIILLTIGIRKNYLRRKKALHDRLESTHRLQTLNKELEKQNNFLNLELRNARHTQNIILPELSTMQERIPEIFLLFKPLREVSGDIYWYSAYLNYIYIGVIDCTGHGIAAALMSLISYVYLHDIIVEQHNTRAGKILSILNNYLYYQNENAKNGDNIGEGLDISLCVIDTTRHMIDFAGAFQRIIHRHNNISDIYLGNSCFIGDSLNQNFTSRIIHYSPSDLLYLFSDGYADQTGGNESKKMRFALFQQYIEQAATLPIREQKDYLEQQLLLWQGSNPQYDDITILGLQCDFKE